MEESKKLLKNVLIFKLKIVLSGSDVPGEGEHKIMDYIRRTTKKNEYDHKTTHCVFGMDADLIILTLSTHMPNIMIIREIIPVF